MPRSTGERRWRGQPGRLEVWYATLTDGATGDGLWLHHELVAPTSGAAYGHGWIATFPAGREPVVQRFGPAALDLARDGTWFAAGDVQVGAGRLAGRAGTSRWDLRWATAAPPLFPFPRWSWEREALPASMVVVGPGAQLSGVLADGVTERSIAGVGSVSHIYGHGNAQRWAWLHADLGAGDLLEIVAAVRRGSRLPSVCFLRLRLDGRDWPRSTLFGAAGFRARIALPEWGVGGIVGRRRLRVAVRLPPEAAVALGYVDPDGGTATCTNSERADAEITVDRWAGRWRRERSWTLQGTAHAEVGVRP